jgi:surface-anchored protein
MTCKDSGGFDITDWVKQTGTVNTNKVGSYTVTYSVVDSFGRTAEKTVTYKVVDKTKATLTGVKASITKSYGAVRDMLTGLKAKDAAGRDLTSRIKVYVKAPGKKGYTKLTDTNYTFETEGTYRVKYVVTNPGSGKKTVARQTIIVKNKQAPVLTDVNKWKSMDVSTASGEAVKYTWKKLMDGVSASLSSGTDITSTVTITVKSPSGDKVTIAKKGSYTFTEAGDYTLVYTAKNPDASGSNKKVTAKRTVTVVVEQEDESDQPDQSQQPDQSEQTDQSEQPEVSVDE